MTDSKSLSPEGPVHALEPSTVGASSGPETGAETTRGDIRLRIFGRTDVGQIREHNEDNFLVADLTRQTRGLLEADRNTVVGCYGTLLGVCDGMGGAAAGEVASQLAVDIIYERMSAGDPPVNRDDLARRLVRAVEAAGLRIFAEAKLDRARRGMGTTATVAALIDQYLFLAQVGDSRAYILRGDRFVQVTRDQSLVNQLIEAGQLTEAEAETFEHNNIILQALGTADTVQVDLTYVELRRGDTLLLCSDGLSGMVRFDEIRDVLLHNDEPLEACRQLTERANEAGGHDNITVIVAKFEGEGLPHPSPLDDLRYRKYPLPESPPVRSSVFSHDQRTIRDQPTPLVPAAAERMPNWGDSERVSDHGPSPSQLAHTMMGAAMSNAALAAMSAAPRAPNPAPFQQPYSEPLPPAEDNEPICIPTSYIPAWMVGGVVITALTLALIAGYYLLR